MHDVYRGLEFSAARQLDTYLCVCGTFGVELGHLRIQRDAQTTSRDIEQTPSKFH